MKEMLMAASKM